MSLGRRWAGVRSDVVAWERNFSTCAWPRYYLVFITIVVDTKHSYPIYFHFSKESPSLYLQICNFTANNDDDDRHTHQFL